MERRKHILIVDDDAELANLLAQAVSEESDEYDVKVARDVDGAMALVHRSQTAQHPFDLVITDIKMLGLSGLELLEALASIAPATKTITMTAYNSPELAERAQELNVFAYLTKPFVLSEFRQIVRRALYPEPSEVSQESRASPALDVDQQATVADHLAGLRSMTGTNVALLMHGNGRVLSIDPSEPVLDVEALCGTLSSAQQNVAEQMAQAFGLSGAVRQSYFGTDSYNICTYRLQGGYVLAVVFGPAVKEGQVWYYMREAAKRLQPVLEGKTKGPAVEVAERRHKVFDLLDQYFPDRQEARAPGRRTPITEPTPTTEAIAESLPPMQPELVQVADRPSPAEIDWEVTLTSTWDEVVKGTNQGFGGMVLDEAKQQGLVSSDLFETAEPEPGTPSVRATNPLSELNWDIAIEGNWDDIASTTDQGFAGMSFEEAKRQGLVNGLPSG